MTSVLRSLMIVVALLALGACRQPDGPFPVPNEEDESRMEDLARNVQNIAEGAPGATDDLTHDLLVYIDDEPDAPKAVADLSRSLEAAVRDRPLDDPALQEIARHLWVTVHAREISEGQLEQLQDELRTALITAGAPEPAVEAVAANVASVQSIVTERPRRWYELF